MCRSVLVSLSTLSSAKAVRNLCGDSSQTPGSPGRGMAENRNNATGIVTALGMLLFPLFSAPDLLCVVQNVFFESVWHFLGHIPGEVWLLICFPNSINQFHYSERPGRGDSSIPEAWKGRKGREVKWCAHCVLLQTGFVSATFAHRATPWSK